MTSPTYGIQKKKKKNQPNLQIHRTETDWCRGHSLRGGWEKWVQGVKRYKIISHVCNVQHGVTVNNIVMPT